MYHKGGRGVGGGGGHGPPWAPPPTKNAMEYFFAMRLVQKNIDENEIMKIFIDENEQRRHYLGKMCFFLLYDKDLVLLIKTILYFNNKHMHDQCVGPPNMKFIPMPKYI